MINKIFDRFFGNKVKMVIATALHGFAEHEQKFIFHHRVPDERIKNILWNYKHGRLNRFSVEVISKCRSKKIKSPPETHFDIMGDSKIIKWFDD